MKKFYVIMNLYKKAFLTHDIDYKGKYWWNDNAKFANKFETSNLAEKYIEDYITSNVMVAVIPVFQKNGE